MAQIIGLPDFIKDYPGAVVVTGSVNGQTAFIIKADAQLIEGFHGPLPISYRAELGLYPTSAVLRLALGLYDRVDAPCVFDTFFNLTDVEQLADFRRLLEQAELQIHFLDMDAEHRLTKCVAHPLATRLGEIELLMAALAYNATLTVIDYDKAKAQMLQDRPLEEYFSNLKEQ